MRRFGQRLQLSEHRPASRWSHSTTCLPTADFRLVTASTPRARRTHDDRVGEDFSGAAGTGAQADQHAITARRYQTGTPCSLSSIATSRWTFIEYCDEAPPRGLYRLTQIVQALRRGRYASIRQRLSLRLRGTTSISCAWTTSSAGNAIPVSIVVSLQIPLSISTIATSGVTKRMRRMPCRFVSHSRSRRRSACGVLPTRARRTSPCPSGS